ncbi:hypothetical protein J6590_012305 [Homalodisca vitripennis]|nr:hypothetical protein J6590_012305 [Homalodisca vitripennis]
MTRLPITPILQISRPCYRSLIPLILALTRPTLFLVGSTPPVSTAQSPSSCDAYCSKPVGDRFEGEELRLSGRETLMFIQHKICSITREDSITQYIEITHKWRGNGDWTGSEEDGEEETESKSV